MILLEFLFFIQHKKVSAGISIYNKKFISVFFCEDFLDSLFKMEKKREQEFQRLYSKKLFKKKWSFWKYFVIKCFTDAPSISFWQRLSFSLKMFRKRNTMKTWTFKIFKKTSDIL